jgi:hypothetical protein
MAFPWPFGLATRYEKRAANYRTMWLIAVCLLWL